MDAEPGNQPPVCKQCSHYFITHDASFSYGCRALDFKSKRLPCLEVEEASGQPCHLFQKKKHGLISNRCRK